MASRMLGRGSSALRVVWRSSEGVGELRRFCHSGRRPSRKSGYIPEIPRMVNAIERQTVISRHYDEGLEEEGEQEDEEEVREKVGSSSILRFTLVQSDLSPKEVKGGEHYIWMGRGWTIATGQPYTTAEAELHRILESLNSRTKPRWVDPTEQPNPTAAGETE